MKMKKLLYITFIMLPLYAAAQKKEAQVAFNGYKGNYILNLFKPASAAHPDGEVVGFRLDRKSTKESNWQTLQIFSSPANYDELVLNLEKGKRLAYEYHPENAYNIDEIWPIYKKTFTYDSLAPFITQQQLAIAFNLVLVDTTANQNSSYQYRVIQLKRDGSTYGNYTSLPVSTTENLVNAERPKASSRQVTGGIFRLGFKAKANHELPQALLIKRKSETDVRFERVQLSYSVESTADSVTYTLIDDQARPDALYQYTITPVNRFGGGGKSVSDTLSVNSISQKMLLPKAFEAVGDSIKKQVVLTWGFLKPELISMVKIYRSEEYEDGYVYLGASNGSNYLDKSIIPGKKYYYYLIASDQLGRSSERSVKVYALVQNENKPTSPMYVEAVQSANGVLLSWQDYNPEIRGFKIYKTYEIDGKLMPLDYYIYFDRKLEGKYSFTDTAKNTNALVGYAVVAESLSNVESDFSKLVYVRQEVSGSAIEVPMLLDFIKDKKSVRIFWRADNRNLNISGFNIYKKVGSAGYIKVNNVPINSSKTSYTDVASALDEAIQYKLTAVSTTGKESGFSNELEVNAGASVTYAPSSLKSSYNENRTAIVLNWQPSQSTVAKYEIYRFARGDEPVKIAETDGPKTSYTDNGFTKEKLNYYFVVAVSSNGIASGPSNQTFKGAVK